MSCQGAPYPTFRNLHAMVALEVPGNALSPEVVRTLQMEDFTLNLRGRTPRRIPGTRSPVYAPLLATLLVLSAQQ